MTRLKWDGGDIPLIGAFSVGSLSQLEIIDLSGLPISPSTEIWTATADSGHTTVITLAMLISLAALGMILYTNDLGFDSLSYFQVSLLAITTWLILSPPFVPIMDSLITSTDGPKLLAFLVQTSSVTMLSKLG